MIEYLLKYFISLRSSSKRVVEEIKLSNGRDLIEWTSHGNISIQDKLVFGHQFQNIMIFLHMLFDILLNEDISAINYRNQNIYLNILTAVRTTTLYFILKTTFLALSFCQYSFNMAVSLAFPLME